MVDALASGASIGNDVEVRVLSWAPKIAESFIKSITYRLIRKFNPPPYPPHETKMRSYTFEVKLRSTSFKSTGFPLYANCALAKRLTE